MEATIFLQKIREQLNYLHVDSKSMHETVGEMQDRVSSLTKSNVIDTLPYLEDTVSDLRGILEEMNDSVRTLEDLISDEDIEDDEEDDDELDVEEEDEEEEFEFEDDEAEITPRVITDNLDPKPTDTTYPFPEKEGTKES